MSAVATYASLRVVGEPSRTVTWVIGRDCAWSPRCDELTDALPDPIGAETRRDALERAITTGAFASPATEFAIARTLGSASDRTRRLEVVARHRHLAAGGAVRLAERATGQGAVGAARDARRRRPSADRTRRRSDGGSAEHRPLAARTRRLGWIGAAQPPLLVLDPRVPGQRPDSPLGSVLGTPVAGYGVWPGTSAS